MAGRARKKPNVYLAPQKVKQALKILTGLLVFVGKPFFFVLSHSIIAVLFIAYIVGHAARIFTASLFRFKPPKRVKPLFKLFWLKIKLFFIRVSSFVSKIRLPEVKALPKLLSFFLFLAFLFFLFFFFILRDLPSPRTLLTREQEVSTKIYDRNGILLYKIYKDKNRTIVSLSEVPLHVRLATLAAEDAEFYNHAGFSVRGIVRAIIKNLRKGELSGGSTITQQLARNAFLTPEKTITRKVKELILAIRLEQYYNKDEVLDLYLNHIPYGRNYYGLESASQAFFNKPAKELTLAESALIAAVPQAPTYYSPWGTHVEELLERKNLVLSIIRLVPKLAKVASMFPTLCVF